MGKKPEIFKPNMEFKDNNKKAYYSYLEEPFVKQEESIEENKLDVIDFLNTLAASSSYVFNRKVVIVTKDKTYDTRIAGKLGNKIITLDNNSIDIDDIIKIYEKK